jgi:hypothetical protein
MFQLLFQSTLKPPAAHMLFEVKRMQKTKAIVALIVASVILVAVVGIAISQFVSAQTLANSNGTTQIPQGPSSYGNPQQGYYPYGQQYGAPYGYGYRMGMCR